MSVQLANFRSWVQDAEASFVYDGLLAGEMAAQNQLHDEMTGPTSTYSRGMQARLGQYFLDRQVRTFGDLTAERESDPYAELAEYERMLRGLIDEFTGEQAPSIADGSSEPPLPDQVATDAEQPAGELQIFDYEARYAEVARLASYVQVWPVPVLLLPELNCGEI